MSDLAVLKPVHKENPAEVILRDLADLGNIDLFFNQVMVCTYVRPKVTMLGGREFHLTDKTVDEDLYQGKVGLVVKLGPTAFVDDGAAQFHGQSVSVGDWVVFRPSDGWKWSMNGRECRVLQDVYLKARIAAPDLVF